MDRIWNISWPAVIFLVGAFFFLLVIGSTRNGEKTWQKKAAGANPTRCNFTTRQNFVGLNVEPVLRLSHLRCCQNIKSPSKPLQKIVREG